MALWKHKTREEMLTWFAEMSDDQLAEAWRDSRDKLLPETFEENFICRGCRYGVKGVGCTARSSVGIKSYKDCEAEVSANSVNWLSRMRDPFEEEGIKAYVDGVLEEDCPYDDGTDGEFGWITGWHFAQKREEQGVFDRL